MKFKAVYRITAIMLSVILSLCIVPSVNAAPTIVGNKYLQNVDSGEYMALKNNNNVPDALMHTTKFGIDKVDIVMKIKEAGSNFIIQPAHTTAYIAAPESIVKRADVMLKENASNAALQWRFYKVEGADDVYSIRPASNSTLALASSDEGEVVLTTYSATRKNQQWKISDFSVKKETENPKIKKYGIDVSHWQGDINWKAVKEYGIDFAILSVGYSGGLDNKFEQNYLAARAEGIDLGLYIYSYENTVKGAKKDAEQVLKTLNGRAIEYPIYFDIEDDAQYKLSVAKKTEMCLEFIKTIKSAGYLAGVYSSESWFENKLDRATLANAGELWLAKWPKSDRADEDHSDYGVWQFRSDGKVAGIDGDVDMNVAFTDYNQLNFTYSGTAITPKYQVANFEGIILTEGVDYTTKYLNNTDAGVGTAVFTGIGNYSGVALGSRFFVINPKSLSKATVSGATDSKRYTGAAIKPKKNIKVKLGDITLKYGQDYTISYKNNKNVGTASLTIKGIGNYTGKTKTYKFEIKKAKLSSATISGVKNKVYTGSARKLSLKVKLSGTTLKNGSDYTVTYKNNVNFGTATVTIKAKGKRVTGSVKKTYNIVPQTPKIKKATNVGLKTLTLNWGHSDYSTKYQLFRATKKDGKYKRIYSSPDRWTYSFKDKGLKEGTHYYYKVRSYIRVNGKNICSDWSDTLKTNTRISNTTFTTEKSKKEGTVTLNIKKDKSVTKYLVYVSKNQDKGFKKVWSGKDLEYVYKVPEKGINYYFRVRTYKSTPNGGIYGQKTTPKKVKM